MPQISMTLDGPVPFTKKEAAAFAASQAAIQQQAREQAQTLTFGEAAVSSAPLAALVVELIDHLSAAGVVSPADFPPHLRELYDQLKT